MDEVQGYIWLKTLPADTKVFDLTTSGDKVVMGFDKYSCAWCKEVIDFREDILSHNVTECTNVGLRPIPLLNKAANV